MALQLRNPRTKELLYKSYDVKHYSIEDIIKRRLGKIDESNLTPDLFTLEPNQTAKTRSLGYVQTSRCVLHRVKEFRYAEMYGRNPNEDLLESSRLAAVTYMIPIKYHFTSNVTHDGRGKLLTMTTTAFVEGIKNELPTAHALDEWLIFPSKVAQVMINMYVDDDLRDKDIVITLLILHDTNEQNNYINKGQPQYTKTALNEIAVEMLGLMGEVLSVYFNFSAQSQLLISEVLVSEYKAPITISLGLQKATHTKVANFFYKNSVENFKKRTAALLEFERSQ
jgi:hypothetical protein